MRRTRLACRARTDSPRVNCHTPVTHSAHGHAACGLSHLWLTERCDTAPHCACHTQCPSPVRVATTRCMCSTRACQCSHTRTLTRCMRPYTRVSMLAHTHTHTLHAPLHARVNARAHALECPHPFPCACHTAPDLRTRMPHSTVPPRSLFPVPTPRPSLRALSLRLAPLRGLRLPATPRQAPRPPPARTPPTLPPPRPGPVPPSAISALPDWCKRASA